MKRFLFIALTVIATISLFIVLFGEKINYTPNHIEVSSNQKTTIDIKNTSDEIAYVWVDCSCKYVNTNDQVNHRKLYTIHSGESIRISTLNFDLDENEIAAILPRIDELTAWASDIKEYALQQALLGTSYPGFKVVEGRSVRKYVDDTAVADAVTKAGYDPYEQKVLGITAMTQLLGKKKFEEILGSLITKPQGKPVLVPESDKRPAINTAYEDFKEE